MIKKGNKIEAIKIYRELNNVGLAEAIGAWSFWKGSQENFVCV
jgi:hypothetical protein